MHMYVTPRQKKSVLIRALIVFIAIPLTAVAVYFVTSLLIRAGAEADPKDVVLSNITSNSLTVSWVTETDATGSLVVVKDQVKGSPILDSRDSTGIKKRRTHYVEITDLEPEMVYDFQIISNDKTYASSDNRGFSFITAAVPDINPSVNPAFGKVTGATGDDAIVYIMANDGKNSYPLSAMVSSSGTWNVDLSSFRYLESGKVMNLTATTQITIAARSGDGKGFKSTSAYSEMFDAQGLLKNPASLTLAPETPIMAMFPERVVLTGLIAQASATPTATATVTATPSVTVTAKPTVNPTSTITGTPVPTTIKPTTTPTATPWDPSKRQFEIKDDLGWNSLISQNTGPVTPDVKVDKDSVSISNRTDTGFTINWITKTAVKGFVKYGTEATSLSSEATDIRDGALDKGTYTVHSVEISKLQPNTEYFYEIHSDTNVFKNGTSPYTLTTYETLASPPAFITVSGKVVNVDKPKDSIVIVEIEDKDSQGSSGKSTVMSALPDENGNWIASVGDMRTSDGEEYYKFTDKDILTASLVVYANSKPATVTAENIEQKSVAITAESLIPKATYSRIPLLTNYNISQTVPTSSVTATPTSEWGRGGEADPTTNPTQYPNQGGQVPDTAIDDTWIKIVAAGLISILIGLVSILFIAEPKTAISETEKSMEL